jgi:general secretion pathway protein G
VRKSLPISNENGCPRKKGKAMNDEVPKRRTPIWLIVIIIVAVLLALSCVIIIVGAAIVGGAVRQAQQRAVLNAARTQIAMFESALSYYEMTVGEHPTTAQGLQALVEPPADLRPPTRWDGPYFDGELPLDPWDNEYQYELRYGEPVIWSLGPDGVDGTDDDIGNW